MNLLEDFKVLEMNLLFDIKILFVLMSCVGMYLFHLN